MLRLEIERAYGREVREIIMMYLQAEFMGKPKL
jgi:hypothetical protein